MTDAISISADEITSVLKSYIDDYKMHVDVDEVGRVMDVGDGIAHVKGLPSAMANEIVEFENGVVGLAFDLEEFSIGVIVLGAVDDIDEGMDVRSTGRILSVPVGDALLGRVVDALGRPEDDKGPINTTATRLLETQAASVVERQPVHEPLQTGIKAIDAMTPIGRGQRQLIIGDRQTGKTAVCIDAIINQKGKGVKCIYVAIAQKDSTVAAVVEQLREHGALEYTVIVNAPAATPAAFQYLAPYSGAAIAQHWMYKGEHALVVYDDLSKQAVAYRQVSLLLRRPPGREAFPGDIFYLHSRLLERAGKLSEELGAGSATALPIVETQANDVSAFIPTNVISITDGQIFLESDLFNSGQRPAINVGVSVSRVGGAAQVTAMKKVAGTLRLTLAQYRELAAFAEFGSDLDSTSRRQLDRGSAMMELLKQKQFSPMEVTDQVVSLWAGTTGHMDDIDLADVAAFEREWIEYAHSKNPLLAGQIMDGWSDEIKTELASLMDAFKPAFVQRRRDLADDITAPSEETSDESMEDVAADLKGAEASVAAHKPHIEHGYQGDD